MGSTASFLESKQVKALSVSTQKLYATALKTFMEFCAETGVNSFTPGVSGCPAGGIQDVLPLFAESLELRKLAGTTIQQYCTIVKIMARWSGSPVQYTYRIPSKQRKALDLKHRDRWFNETDIRRCLEYRFPDFHERNHLIVCILVETGARVREIAGMTVASVDIDNRTLWIDDSKTMPRAVFVSHETVAKLKAYMKTIQPAFKGTAPPALFPGVIRIQEIINAMLVDLGLKNGKDGRGPHTFRHYVATYLHYEGGMDIKDVAFLLGDTPETIRDNYLHPTPAMLRKRTEAAMGWK